MKRGNPKLVTGVSGNAAGRPIGSRNRLTNALIADLAASWEKHGRSVLERLRVDDPATYASLAVRLVPKVVQTAIELRTGPLDSHEMRAVRRLFDLIDAQRAVIPRPYLPVSKRTCGHDMRRKLMARIAKR
jgi:hypothetical protein